MNLTDFVDKIKISIEDLLYTKSPNLLRINNLDNLESVKNIELKDSNTQYNVY